MSKLRKIALVGNIGTSDLEFKIGSNLIEVHLKNQEKTLHEGPWEDAEYYYDKSSESAIGFIEWETSNHGEMYEIYVSYVEVRKEYAQTRVAMLILKNFEENILLPLLDQHGKENIIVSADFANQKLSDMLNRISKKKGLKLYDISSPEYEKIIGISDNGSEEFSDGIRNRGDFETELKDAGYNSENGIIKNQNLKNYVSILEKYNDTISIFGYVDISSGDISFSYKYFDNHPNYMFVLNNSYIEFQFGTANDLAAINSTNTNLASNIVSSLSDYSLSFPEDDSVFTVQQLVTYFNDTKEQPKTASIKRLQKK